MPSKKRSGYKLCKSCGSPILKRGQKRKHPDEYRHARGCPKASEAERRITERIWAGDVWAGYDKYD